MDKGSPEAGGKIEKQELTRSPHPLQGRTKRPEGIHIEENMHKPPVHKHMRPDLPEGEVRVPRIAQCEPVERAGHVEGGGHKKEDIDKQQVLDAVGESTQWD